MRRAHAQVTEWMEAAGFACRVDAIGNLFGRREAAEPPARTLLVGSHLDTVPNAGKFDGILGVLLGIAVGEALREDQVDLPFALEVVGFADEEGVRYGMPFLGSRAASGCFDERLLERRDATDIPMSTAIRNFGGDPQQIPAAAYRPEDLVGYLEAHIEQGPVLRPAQGMLGVVEAIAGQTRVDIEFQGRAAHAGTTPMDQRQDALVAAAQLVVAAEQLARSTPGLVATVGKLEVTPNAANVIPSRAVFTVDVRHGVDEVRQRVVASMLDQARALATERGLTCHVAARDEHAVVETDRFLTGLLEEAVSDAGVECRRMVSGAGHDAEIMAAVTPAAMLFLPCHDGISHHPDESVAPEDVSLALEAMVGAVLKIAERNR